MYRIAKQFTFEASHQLRSLPEGHKCRRMHGHSYVVELIMESEYLDANGFVVDYGDMDIFKRYIDTNLDHRHLNDIIDNPTAEVIAKHLFEWCRQLWRKTTCVRVSETRKTWAEYRP